VVVSARFPVVLARAKPRSKHDSFFFRSIQIRTRIINNIFTEVRIQKCVRRVNYYNDLAM
jgi:hypothetical protein